ncbi:hypothetical protein QTP70_030588 [Hemibagrus guttatus]|uniref:E3 ubiquitin-protein ligase n=1 Tax=Hemibagrus guttatus TaxID=175788 RepID=A0AAE0QFJ0_9TELE|nr:hypothetical protein QTP70_030588 [Hemibagrus guttatus]
MQTMVHSVFQKMAEMGHTVCVRGLPADMEQERLEDKLLIHFLRERNGGGEISSIRIKATDPCAIITFEDSRVALNVYSCRPQFLEVDGKMYELSLSFPWQESLHLNKVIRDMSVTIDCNYLPLGEETIKTITENFPGLDIHYIKPQRLCTIKGSYSEVSDLVSHLKELLVDFEPPNEEDLQVSESPVDKNKTMVVLQGSEASKEEHPNPGLPFEGGVFEAYLPLTSKGQGFLQCLEKAFKQGFTFTVCPNNSTGRAKITWSRIPHKTIITGGKSGNGYPDTAYLKDLAEALRTCGIENAYSSYNH